MVKKIKQNDKTNNMTKTKSNNKTKSKTINKGKNKGRKKTKEEGEKTLIKIDDNNGKKYLDPKKGKYILVLVESPGKIKKISSYLGKGYEVMATFGHIIDLPKSRIGIDFDNDYTPEYHIITGKKKFEDKMDVVANIRKAALKAKRIVIAADDDREGEMIGWSCKQILGLDENDYDRITFNSITKSKILEAMKKPKKINMDMVRSQKARRFEDKIAGFTISPLLSDKMGVCGLSAGRVQSVVTRLICDKEDEIEKFYEGDNASYIKFNGLFECRKTKMELQSDLYETNENGKDIVVNVPKYKQAKKMMVRMSKSKYKIVGVRCKKVNRNPPPPFTTSTVQQDASNKLRRSVKETMSSLQKLYEAGLTTYLRTDSTNLSPQAMKQCKDKVYEMFGKVYYKKGVYTNKKGNTQEAHEAIRPVDMNKVDVKPFGKINNRDIDIYKLVWKRTLASQMKPAVTNTYTVDISISKMEDNYFRSAIHDIIFPGFLAVYNTGTHGQKYDEMEEGYELSIPKEGNKVTPKHINAIEDYKKPPMRYTEAGLVKTMDPKQLNIGRPATYASIISKIQDKGYVKIKNHDGIKKDCRTMSWKPKEEIIEDSKTINLGKEKNKFTPTKLGMEVTKILISNFSDLMEYKYTSLMENELDEIAGGEKELLVVVDSFWQQLNKALTKMGGMKKKDVNVLGQHPTLGVDIMAAMGKYGPMIKMRRSNNSNEYKYAPIREPLTIETITLDDALKLLKYPRTLGVYKNKSVVLKKSSTGYYVTCEKFGKSGANLDENIDPDELTLEEGIKLLEDKMKKQQEKMKDSLYFHQSGNIQYIIKKDKFTEDGKYLMVRNIKKNTKPLFITLSSDMNMDNIKIADIKKIISASKKS